MNKTARNSLGIILIVLMLMTTLTLLNVSIFNYYANIALYINLAFVMLGFLLCWKVKLKGFVYILFLLFYLILSILINNGGFGSVITFIVPLLMLTIFSNSHYTTKSKKILITLGVIVIFSLFLYSFPYSNNYRQYAATKINPNTLGMFMMFFFMIICILGDFKTLKSKVVLLLLFILSFFGMYNFESRGTTLALCCFALMLIIPQKIYNRKRFISIVILLLIVGTAFPFIYLSLYNNGYNLVIFGKSLFTGRERIWSNMFSLMEGNPLKILFGLGSKTILWENDLNVHNNFFNIIVNFGIIGFILFYGLIIFQIWKAAKYISNPTIKKSLIMFVCSVLILGFSETTSLWAVVFPFAYFGLMVANSEYSLIENSLIYIHQKQLIEEKNSYDS